MPKYVSLQKFTDQGVKDIKNTLGRDIGKRLEALGIKVTAYRLTMGEYDEVVVWEAPSEEVAMTWLLELGAMGNRKTTTLRAFDLDQFSEMISKLP